MTLKELQNMIKEEFDAYMDEAKDDVDVSVSDNDVDAEMGDMGDEGAEDMLRKIYDMLKDKFEAEDMDDMGDDAAPEMEEMEEDMMGEVKDDDKMEEDADLDESDGYTGKAGKGGTGYDAKDGGKGRTGYDAGSKALQERFQRLANIIK